MAARAHAVHDYSFAGASARPRRQIWLQDDEPVVLPRGERSHTSGATVFAAVLASALVAGAAYAVYWTSPPALSETPAAPLEKSFQADPLQAEATLLNALQGPARSVPGLAAPTMSEATDIPGESGFDSGEARIDDSAPGVPPSLSQPALRPEPALTQPTLPEPVMPKKEAPSAAPPSPYPDPVTAPPELIEPATTAPEPPRLDAENPY